MVAKLTPEGHFFLYQRARERAALDARACDGRAWHDRWPNDQQRGALQARWSVRSQLARRGHAVGPTAALALSWLPSRPAHRPLTSCHLAMAWRWSSPRNRGGGIAFASHRSLAAHHETWSSPAQTGWSHWMDSSTALASLPLTSAHRGENCCLSRKMAARGHCGSRLTVSWRGASRHPMESIWRWRSTPENRTSG